MPLVKFIKENKEIDVPAGANLRKEAIKAGINVHQGLNGFGARLNKYVNCHGIGQCGMCRVKITKGMENASPMGLMEKPVQVSCTDSVTPIRFDPCRVWPTSATKTRCGWRAKRS